MSIAWGASILWVCAGAREAPEIRGGSDDNVLVPPPASIACHTQPRLRNFGDRVVASFCFCKRLRPRAALRT